eukprot:2238086-Prymnesium_polylepis.1
MSYSCMSRCRGRQDDQSAKASTVLRRTQLVSLRGPRGTNPAQPQGPRPTGTGHVEARRAQAFTDVFRDAVSQM